MTFADDPNHPENGGSWEYSVPLNYKWTGYEQVIATNRRGFSSDPFPITQQQLSYFDGSGNLVSGQGGRDPFGGGFHSKYVIEKNPDGSLKKDGNGNYIEVPDTQYVHDVCNDFIEQGAQAGDTITNLKTGKTATITAVEAHKLTVAWIGVPGTGDRSAWAFKYLQPYSINNVDARHFDTLGYRKFSVNNYSNALWPDIDLSPREIGLNLSNPATLSVAPYDIVVRDTYTNNGTSTTNEYRVSCNKAVGVAMVGAGDFDHWNYESLRKLDFSTTPLVMDINTSGNTFAVLLKNDCVAKVHMHFSNGPASDWRVVGFDVEVYQGI